MFAYEGLGSIYWHMVAKLLLATSERTFAAVEQGAPAEVVSILAADPLLAHPAQKAIRRMAVIANSA